MFVLSLLLPPLVALLLTIHLGYAFCHTLLPDELRPYRALLMAPAGLALLILLNAALTTTTSLPPPSIALGLAVAAAPVNGWLWWRHREHRTQNTEHRTHLSVLCSVFCVVLFLLALLPPIAWGFSAPIGSNWDAAEFYIPLGRALQLRSQRDLGTLPRNPLVQIMSTPPVSGRIHAFSYLHAAVSSATGVDPLRSYAAVMAFVLALQPLGVYVLGRVLALGRAAALVATAMLSLGWLPLWVTYNSFSNHLLALPLLPAALAASVVALGYGGGRAVASGALFTTGLATAYFPAMSAYLVLFAPAALVLIALLRMPLSIAGRGLALGGAAFAFSLPAQAAFWLKEGFLDEIQRRNTGFQIVEWLGLADALGIVATFNRESIANDPRLATAAMACAAVLALAALLSRRYPLLWAMLLGAAGYAAYTALDGYFYGFYKGATFALPLLALVSAAGAEALWRAGAGRFGITRGAAVAASALLLGLQAATIWQLQRSYTAAGPQLWSAADLEAVAVSAQLPAGASVLLVAPSDRPPPITSLLAYTLLGHELHGRISTGYTTLGDTQTDVLADAALLPRDESPALHGYDARQLGWSGAGMRLYRRDATVRVHRVFARAYELRPGAALRLRLGADAIALDGEPAPVAGPAARVAVAIASFGPASVELRGTTVERFELSGGLAQITSAPLQQTAELRNTGTLPVFVQWAEVRATAAAGGVVLRDDVFVRAVPVDAPTPASVASEITLHTAALPEGHQKLTGLLVVSYTADGHAQHRAGQWVFFPAAGTPLRIELELATLRASLAATNAPAELAGSGTPAGDGAYELTLLLANNAEVAYATRLWSWRIENGRAVDAAGDVVVADLVSLPRAAVELGLETHDGSLRLRGYTLAGKTLRPGATLDIDLVWQSLRQLGADLQARAVLEDGSGRQLAEQTLRLGAPEHGTSTWLEGELAEQSFQLAVPDDAAPGPATLRLELLDTGGGSIALGDRPVEIELKIEN